MSPPRCYRIINNVSPADWAFFLRYLGNRATQGVERISGEVYARTVSIDGVSGLFTLQPAEADSALQLTIAGPVRRFADHIVQRVRAMLDLETDLLKVHEVLSRDPHFGVLLSGSSGIRVPGGWSRFELLIRTIVGQQVTVKAGTTIMGRIASRFGTPLETEDESVPMCLFPAPVALAEGDWTGIGMPGKRVATIQHLAKAIHEQQIPFPDESQDFIDAKQRQELKAALLDLPGIGPWTVEYFSLRGLRDANAWPESDLILKREVQRLTGEVDIRKSKRVRDWEPFRGYAAMMLWNQAALFSDRKPD